jgi:hypothetical protein
LKKTSPKKYDYGKELKHEKEFFDWFDHSDYSGDYSGGLQKFVAAFSIIRKYSNS